MSRLFTNTTIGERRRGCVFSENFINKERILENNGVPSGSITYNDGYISVPRNYGTYISYYTEPEMFANDFTVIVKVSMSSIGTTSFICGTSTSPAVSSFDGWALYLGNTGTDWVVGIGNGSTGLTASSGYEPSVDEVCDVACVWDNTTRLLSIYVNGEYKKSTSTPLPSGDYNANRTMTVGGVGSLSLGGNIYDLKVFNKKLSAKEIKAYYDNDMLDYENDCVLDLPMGLEQHDITNKRTLDISGNNHHATFGDGSNPATFPEKLDKKGYKWNGTSTYLNVDKSVMSDIYTNQEMTIAVTFRDDLLNQSYGSIFMCRGIGKKHQIIPKYGASGSYGGLHSSLRINDTRTDFNVGGGSANHILFNQINVLVFTFDGTTSNFYLNGRLVQSTTTQAGTLTDVDADLEIGSEGTSYYYKGDILRYKMYSKALNHTQVMDLSYKMLRGLNK